MKIPLHKPMFRSITMTLVVVALLMLVGSVAAANGRSTQAAANAASAPPTDYEIIESSPQNFSAGGWAGWSCPTGKVVLGGGVEGVKTETSRPAGPNSIWPHYTYGANEYGWVVRSAEAGTATIWMVCADEPTGYQLVESSGLSFNGSGGWGGWSCPAGKVVLGGGVENLFARSSRPAGPNSIWPHYTFGADEYGWVAQNGGAATTGSKIAVTCSDPLPGYQIVESNPQNFGPTGAAGWSCPADTFVTGGGVQNLIASNSRPAGPGTVTDFGYTYGPTEYGWLANNGENAPTTGSLIVPICVEALAPPPQTGTIVINKAADPQDGTDFPFTIDPDAAPLLYREIFPLGDYSGVTQGARLNALDEGWRGYWDGRDLADAQPAPQNTTSLQIFGSGSTPELPVNSNPVNSGEGNAFWSPSESRVILYTEEFSFPRADLSKISYETRHNDADQPQQDFPLLKIDGKWYSPDCQFVNTDVPGNSTWIPASWLVDSITWMELDIDPATNRAVVPGQDCAQTGDFDPPLQTGLSFANLGTAVEAFGLYLPDPESNPQANMRFDNYTFYGVPTGDFILDDANPDDNDGITSQQVFVTPAGAYDVTELVPQGWNLADITCVEDGTDNTTTTDDTASIVLEGDETVTCTFSNAEAAPANACPVDPNVGNELTEMYGQGMGSPTRTKMMAKVTIPFANDVVDLYGQMAAKEYNAVRYVRFIYGDKTYDQIQPETDLGDKAAISWWGADLDETKLSVKPFVKGRWFLDKGMKKMKSPRAMIIYSTRTTGDQYANAWSTFNAPGNFVAGTPGFSQVLTNTLTIPTTQAVTDITVQLAVTDVNRDPRTVDVTVKAGTAEETVTLTGPTNKKSELLNLFEVTLLDVPAGVSEIEIIMESVLDEGDSAALLGAAAHYTCEPELMEPAPSP